MVHANTAIALNTPGVVSKPDELPTQAVETAVYAIEQIGLIVFEKASRCIGAEISHLDHEGQLTVHEQRRLNDAIDG